jgi:2',3'-cyclic-nucleotide 2'-phosphodiesterase (5'-nucleotidase family)
MIVEEIPQQLTLDDLHDILPHSIRMVKFTVTGLELLSIMQELYDIGNYLKTTHRRDGISWQTVW